MGRKTLGIYLATMVALGSVLLAGCARTFLISKDCTTYYLGSQEQKLHDVLCASGDFPKILNDSGLPEEASTELYEAQCTKRSREKLQSAYGGLSREQQEALRSAFRKNGYEINSKPAPNFRAFGQFTAPDAIDLCPPGSY